jgi:serine/threonine protein kinase
VSTTAPPEIDGLVFVEHLGTGGYSDVYLYERRAPRMKIAVKVLKEGRLAESQLAQFAAEAETMAELADHPYIVQVFSTDTTEDGRPFLVMKYYPPPNLGARAAQERFSVADVLRTGVKIGGAVETAHRAGILHRDIKPANILVSQYGEPGLTDFGIAGRAADTSEDDDLGVSIPWSPPEVLSGESNGSIQADVYALAATLWHLLVGRSPFEIAGGDNAPRALMSRILRSAPPATGRADVPASLERLLQQAMAKKASNRPRSALEFARSLQGIEQELRFARTEIVTGDLGDSSAAHTGPWDAPHYSSQRTQPDRPATPDAGPDATRLRAPTRVTAQPVQQPRFAPPAVTPSPSAEPPTTARPARPQQPATAQVTSGQKSSRLSAGSDAPPATVLRPARPQTAGHPPTAVGATDADDTEASPRKKGVKTRWVVIVASAALIAAVVVGVVLSSRGGKPGDRAGDHGYSNAPQPGAGFDPPQQPSVTASRTGNKVTFSWTYDNPAKGDHFVVSDGSSNGGEADWAPRQVSSPSVTLAELGNKKLCVTVQAVRSNGQSSLPSDPVCG